MGFFCAVIAVISLSLPAYSRNMCKLNLMMLIKKNRMRMVFFAVLLTVLASVAGLTGSAGDGEERPVWRWSLEDEGWLRLELSVPLQQLSGGGAVALGMTLRLADGWSWGEIALGEGAEGMTLTMGECSDGRFVKMLLDGYPSSDACAILRLQVIRSHETEPLGVEFGEMDGIFFVDGRGNIQKVPVSTEDFSTENRDDIQTTEPHPPATGDDISDRDTEPVTEPTTEPVTGSLTDTVTETEAPPLSEIGPPSPLPPTRFVGCQETSVRNGTYGVRFLFWGETPVICVEGGGSLTAESRRVLLSEGSFSSCTFYGLRGEGDYVFLVYTPDGIVEVRYRNATFMGYRRYE